jgi:hypothetical protein
MKEGTLKFPTTCEAPHAAGGLGGPLSKRRLPGYLPANPAGARLQCPYGLHAPSSPGYRAPLSLGSAWTRLRQPGPTHARGLPFQGSTLLGPRAAPPPAAGGGGRAQLCWASPPPPLLYSFLCFAHHFLVLCMALLFGHVGHFQWLPLTMCATENVHHLTCLWHSWSHGWTISS